MSIRGWAPYGVGAIALALSGGAFAQVETVVVTAKTLPFDQVTEIDKTGSPIADVPRSIEIVPSDLFIAQGATQLSQTLTNVSGSSQGGQYNFGFFDRFIIRGLNATFLNDGLPEGTSDLTGFVHSLTGVERVEILKGPGSALYGSAEEGGTINLVHYRPSDVYGALLSEQYGSYGTTTTDISLTGPTGIDGVDGRLDGEFQHSDGFRDLTNQTGEIYGALSFRPANHDIELRVEYHNIQDLPDAEGIPFSPPSGTGDPLSVPTSFKYYTPYAFANQEIERVFLSDAWTWNDSLVVNLRTAYSARNVDLARNSGGSVAFTGGLYALTKRQLREQKDNVGDFTFQAEPTWTFDTGGLKHVLVTGVEAREINAGTVRETAALPNIANIYAPVVNDGTMGALTFQCSASYSCDNAKLLGQFYGLYAIDQIDVTDALKVRLSVREDWFDTEAEARSPGIPANPGQEEPCTNPPAGSTACPLVPGSPAIQKDALTSWDTGLVYFLTPDLSVFGGYSSAAYPIFNTEEPESVGQTPETGTQIETGLRFQQASWLSASSSLYRATRDNVFTLIGDVPTVFSYRVEGWESDVNLTPTDGWNIIANFAAQTPIITNYPATPADIGRYVPSVPTILANLWTTYDIPIPGVGTEPQIGFGARYRDHEFGDVGNTRRVPGVPLFDTVLGIPYREWEFQVGVSNIFDRQNYVDAAGTGSGAAPGPDRTYFVKLSYKPD
ncbi:MAG TPA: TonB-dependent receptor [Rhizomicrobium sp.]|nr:TonB-dependent receptor [Rhizomicrobium sp.]